MLAGIKIVGYPGMVGVDPAMAKRIGLAIKRDARLGPREAGDKGSFIRVIKVEHVRVIFLPNAPAEFRPCPQLFWKDFDLGDVGVKHSDGSIVSFRQQGDLSIRPMPAQVAQN